MSIDCLCISAGGAKGFAALGALQCLQDQRVLDVSRVRHMSGTSVGALICFFLSIGYGPVELMVELCRTNCMQSLTRRSWEDILHKESVYDTDDMLTKWEELCFAKRPDLPTMKSHFESTGVDLIICTYNYTQRRIEYIRHDTHPEVPCLLALKMSSSLPFLFAPTIYGDNEFVDGAFADPFPIEQVPFQSLGTLGIYLKDQEVVRTYHHRLFDWVQKVFELVSIPVTELHERRMQSVKTSPHVYLLHLSITDVPVYQLELRKGQQLDLFSAGFHQAKKAIEAGDFAFKAQTA